ncbi:MAG: AAA family ATPase [Proteobacteria bacterium]|nr:AAA family ATPase [Pseudomonadota bacterium]MBU1716260.1 AAA family ATPase [Pseudomonadota bacterium]
MNHLSFFSLNDDPFRLTPDRDFFFPAANHTALGNALRFGLDQGDGFIIVTGEVGTGKTILLRMLMSDIGRQFETALLVSPQLTPKQLVMAILYDIGLEDKADNRQSLDQLIRLLNDYLAKLAATGKRLLIIVDEAQNLPDESIEQLRLLSNFESDKHKWLQIILVGQPELKKNISRPHLRQLLQRVTIMETLNPLEEKEISLYVHFRLNRAGRGDIRLSKQSRKLLWRYTKGFPRLINKVMSRSLLIAYARQQAIDHKVIKEAAASLHLTRRVLPDWFPLPGWLFTVTAFFVLLASVILLRQVD